MAKLNLGAGSWQLDGWDNVDCEEVDLSRYPWPWAKNSYDEIMASHILEHFSRDNAFAFLYECRRILKPGGVLHIAVPDMDKFIDCHLSGDFSPLGGYEWTSLDEFLGGNKRDVKAVAKDKHYYMWCEASLSWTLQRIGFTQFACRIDPLPIDSPVYTAISLYMDAVK